MPNENNFAEIRISLVLTIIYGTVRNAQPPPPPPPDPRKHCHRQGNSCASGLPKRYWTAPRPINRDQVDRPVRGGGKIRGTPVGKTFELAQDLGHFWRSNLVYSSDKFNIHGNLHMDWWVAAAVLL